MYHYARDREDEELTRRRTASREQWHQRADDIRLVNLGFVGAFLAIAAVGISRPTSPSSPETPEIKRRGLPPLEPRGAVQKSALAPILSYVPGPGGGPAGFFAGIAGTAF